MYRKRPHSAKMTNHEPKHHTTLLAPLFTAHTGKAANYAGRQPGRLGPAFWRPSGYRFLRARLQLRRTEGAGGTLRKLAAYRAKPTSRRAGGALHAELPPVDHCLLWGAEGGRCRGACQPDESGQRVKRPIA